MIDGVEIDEADIELLTQFFFEVSSPELFEPITIDGCKQWLSLMEQV